MPGLHRLADPALFAAFLVGIRYSGRTTAEAMHAKLTVATDDAGAAAVHVIRALIASLRAVVEPRPQLLQARLAGGERARRPGHRGR